MAFFRGMDQHPEAQRIPQVCGVSLSMGYCWYTLTPLDFLLKIKISMARQILPVFEHLKN